jgi:molybdopterin synthase catalytic subunit
VVRAVLRSTPIDVSDLLAAVADPRAGGLGLFVGTVRERDDGRAVVALSYEAHPSAHRLLTDVATRLAVADVVAVAVEHRLGRLVVGDVAVAVAVSAEHRAEALGTAHALIDAVKAEVPIWKRQEFAAGGHEWVGTG